MRVYALLVLAGVSSGPMPAAASPAQAPPVRGAGAMATRGVARYLGLERRLLQAIADRDRGAAAALLADGFEAQAAPDGDALDAPAWIDAQMRAAAGRPGAVRQLALREFDDLAIVNFELQTATPGQSTVHHPTLFVVDVWRTSTGRLLVRYASTERSVARAPEFPRGRE